MGKSYEKLKERNGFLEKKLEHFLSMIDVLYKNVMDRENEIDELTEVIKKTEKFSSRLSDTILDSLKSDSSASHQNCEATEAFNTKEAFFKFKRSGIAPEKAIVDAPTNFSVGEMLECIKDIHGYTVGDKVEIMFVGEHVFGGGVNPTVKPAVKVGASMLSLEIVDKYFKKIESKGFSSRFMPNVKFCVMGDKRELLEKNGIATSGLNYLRTNREGLIWSGCNYQGKFDDEWTEQEEVSIYEAIPELVPEGMVYDKESDSIISESHYTKITVDIRDVVNFGGERYYRILKK